MKKRWLVLLIVFLAMLFFYFEHREGSEPSVSATAVRLSYTGANQEYFGNTLPENIMVTMDEHDPKWEASTTKRTDGIFWIRFNEKYITSERTANLILLHEMCHVKVWDRTHEDPSKFDGDKDGGHNEIWRSCMLELDAQGAFRMQLIDGYQEKMP
jgi:hypothetical protein